MEMITNKISEIGYKKTTFGWHIVTVMCFPVTRRDQGGTKDDGEPTWAC